MVVGPAAARLSSSLSGKNELGGVGRRRRRRRDEMRD